MLGRVWIGNGFLVYDGDGGHLHRTLVHLGSHDRPAAAAAVNLAAAAVNLAAVTSLTLYSCHG